MAKEVLIDAAENVAASVLSPRQSDCADQVDEFSESPLIDRWPCVVLGKNAFQARVVALDGIHRRIESLADRLESGGRLNLRPARLRWHPEDVLSDVLVAVLPIGAGNGRESRVPLVKCVGNVLEEDQSERNVLVLGSVEVATHLVGRLPQLRFEAEIAVRARLGRFARDSCFPGRL